MVVSTINHCKLSLQELYISHNEVRDVSLAAMLPDLRVLDVERYHYTISTRQCLMDLNSQQPLVRGGPARFPGALYTALLPHSHWKPSRPPPLLTTGPVSLCVLPGTQPTGPTLSSSARWGTELLS